MEAAKRDFLLSRAFVRDHQRCRQPGLNPQFALHAFDMLLHRAVASPKDQRDSGQAGVMVEETQTL